MDRDRTKQLTEHTKKINIKKQELNLTKNLRKEVEVGANGTQKEHAMIATEVRELLYEHLPNVCEAMWTES